jgi:hypothetical protein
VPAPAIWPKRFFAVWGSNRSVAMSQNPDPSRGPTPDTWRYTRIAAARGAHGSSSHSSSSIAALTTKAAGTNIPGDT